MNKIVWVLGAGLSKSLGGPLLGDLFSQAQLDRVLLRYASLFNPEAKQLWRDITRFYAAGVWGVEGARPLQRQWSHAEAFLERLDIARESAVERDRLERFHIVHTEHIGTLATRRDLIAEEQQPVFAGQTLVDEAFFNRAHHAAIQLMAAECCAFLEDADPGYEIWRPYRRWAQSLTRDDTVLTFNYDRVPDILSGETLWVPSPSDQPSNGTRARVFKLHGSVNWIERTSEQGVQEIVKADPERFGNGDHHAALLCNPDELAIATPGPTKERRTRTHAGDVTESKRLAWLWHRAEKAIEEADAIVLLGYSLPPTDASTRSWLLSALRTAVRNKIARDRHPSHEVTRDPKLPIHIVLGPNINDAAPARLAGLLSDLEGTVIRRRPLYVEDFLDAFERDDLMRKSATPA